MTSFRYTQVDPRELAPLALCVWILCFRLDYEDERELPAWEQPDLEGEA